MGSLLTGDIKTGQQLFIKWEKPMQELIDKYDTSDIPYLLPIIRNNGMDEWHQYQNEAHRINRNFETHWQTDGFGYSTYYLCCPPCMGQYCSK